MMLSFGSCRMSSRTTVRPPMPESKTPMGAAFVMLPRKTRENSHASIGCADLNVRVEVCEISRYECVGARKEMIEHDDRNPVLEVCPPRAHPIRQVLVPRSIVDDRQPGLRV